MYKIIIIGAGGFGREVYQWAKDSFDPELYRIKGFLSPNKDDLIGFNINSPILGHEDNYQIENNDRFICAVGNIDLRKKIVEKLKSRNALFVSLIHPSAIVADTALIGEGVILCPFTLVSDHAVIGDFTMMNFYSSCGHDSKVGSFSVLSPYATVNGFVTLKNEVFLGTHSTVVANKTVGYQSKVNANSVAMSNVPDYSFVFGVPGKVKTIFS